MAGGDDDGHVGMRADLPQQIQAVLLTETKIEDDQAGLTGLEIVVQFSSVGGCPGRDIVLLEISDHHLSQGGIVIDNDDVSNICKHTSLSKTAVTNRVTFKISNHSN
jgi:D-serine deaminase-like pyridoxal phosphate-dependent protein